MPSSINNSAVSNQAIQQGASAQTAAKVGDKNIKTSETSSSATLLSRPKNTSGVSEKESRRAQKQELVKDLVGLVEAGRGGERALMNSSFENTFEKLSVLMIKVDADDNLKDILSNSKGFSSKPRGITGTDIDNKNLYQFLKAHTSRDSADSETFCLQSMVKDVKAWTTQAIDKQSNSFNSVVRNELKERLEKSNDVGAEEYRKNPAMRQPESVEEAAQYLYYAAGLFGSKEEWLEMAKEPTKELFSAVDTISYEKAKRIYDKNKANGVYS